MFVFDAAFARNLTIHAHFKITVNYRKIKICFAFLCKLITGEFNLRSPHFNHNSGRMSEYLISWEL